MGKRRRRQWDITRTDLLGLSELSVESGRGSSHYFCVWNNDLDDDPCPLCGNSVIKMQDLFTKSYTDLVVDGENKYAVTLEYNFYKWRCLNEGCRHIFAKEIRFATKYDNVTHRLENEVARLVVDGRSYGEICDQLDGPITRQAVGQIFNRWVRTRDEKRKMIQPLQLAVLSGKTDKDRYTVFLNLDDGIKVIDILYGVDSAAIAAVLRSLNGLQVKTVITDCDPIIAATVKDCCPNALHIIPVDYWLKLASDDFKALAHKKLKWCTVYDKEKLIMMQEAELGLRGNDLKRLLAIRPAIAKPHVDFNRLRGMVANRDELWVYDELVDWMETVDEEFREEMVATEIQLGLYREEIEAHMHHRDAVPEQLYLLATRLEKLLKKQRTFSTEVLKARVLYSIETDLNNWIGIPIEDVLEFLDKEQNRRDLR